jgi:hypothetical protein
MERRILAAATRTPRTGKALAERMGRKANSHFRGALRTLVRRGLVLHVPEGYRLPDGA